MEQVNKKGPQSPPFLATTAIEDFWDASGHIVFLGEWCKRSSRKDYLENLSWEVCPNDWYEDRKLGEIRDYINGVYELLLPRLATTLNSLHGCSYSDRYWRILLGPWLMLYVDVIYDRHRSLKSALKRYPDLTTIALSPESFIVPRDSNNFFNLNVTDSYNLQIYSKILNRITSKKIPVKKLNIDFQQKPICNNRFMFRTGIGKLIRWCADLCLNVVVALPTKKVYLSNAYFPLNAEMVMLFKTLGRICPLFKEPQDLEDVPSDSMARVRFSTLYTGDDEFVKVITDLLPSDIPQCFVESYSKIVYESEKTYPENPRGIFSAVDWYRHEMFKHWAAKSAETGTQLIGTQHGGGYGCHLVAQREDYETSITDRYYSWGWERLDCKSRVIPFPATKFVGRRTRVSSKYLKKILFTGNMVPRYHECTQSFNNYQISKYLDYELKFYGSLTEKIRKAISIRLFVTDYDRGVEAYWKKMFPDVVFERWGVPFSRSLSDSRIFLCDHLSTTLCEALSIRKPSILFWDPTQYPLRPDAKPYYDELRDIGILYNTPEQAAAALNQVCDNIEEWWMLNERQKIVGRFCSRFARSSTDALNIWTRELDQMTQ